MENELKDLILTDFGKRNNVNVASLTSAEIRDIILGMEIAAPSQQRQQMAELEKQAREQSDLTAVRTKTINKHGDEIYTETTSSYEQQAFKSRTDWKQRAVTASNLHLRTKYLYVSDEDVDEDGYAYILPQNLLRRLVCISDLRTQCVAYLYGMSPPDASQIKEIHSMVLVPQIGTHKDFKLPNAIPEGGEDLEGLEFLGIIHTQPKKAEFLAPHDVLAAYNLKTEWIPEKHTIITCAFTPGSCFLNSYRVTEDGMKWAKSMDGKPGVVPGQESKGYNSKCYTKGQLLLSKKFLGFFLVPENDVWNYNFLGVRWSASMEYKLKNAQPYEFFAPLHRPMHFLSFKETERSETVDIENPFG